MLDIQYLVYTCSLGGPITRATSSILYCCSSSRKPPYSSVTGSSLQQQYLMIPVNLSIPGLLLGVALLLLQRNILREMTNSTTRTESLFRLCRNTYLVYICRLSERRKTCGGSHRRRFLLCTRRHSYSWSLVPGTYLLLFCTRACTT